MIGIAIATEGIETGTETVIGAGIETPTAIGTATTADERRMFPHHQHLRLHLEPRQVRHPVERDHRKKGRLHLPNRHATAVDPAHPRPVAMRTSLQTGIAGETVTVIVIGMIGGTGIGEVAEIEAGASGHARLCRHAAAAPQRLLLGHRDHLAATRDQSALAGDHPNLAPHHHHFVPFHPLVPVQNVQFQLVRAHSMQHHRRHRPSPRLSQSELLARRPLPLPYLVHPAVHPSDMALH